MGTVAAGARFRGVVNKHKNGFVCAIFIQHSLSRVFIKCVVGQNWKE